MKKIYLDFLFIPVLLFSCFPVFAQHAGSLDSTFGKNGISVNNPERLIINSFATLSNGNIVAAGDSSDDAMLMRYTADGVLDAGFGNNGVLDITKDIPPLIYIYSYYEGINVFALPGNKMIVCALRESAFTNPNPVFLQYDANGKLDSSFGTAGVIVTDVTSPQPVTPVIQKDNKILLQAALVVERIKTNGARDSSFGINGSLLVSSYLNNSTSYYQNTSVAIDSNSRVIVLGYGRHSGSNNDFITTRFSPEGKIDSSFGVNGVSWKITTSTNEISNDLVILPDNSIVEEGSMQNSANLYLKMVKLLQNGSVDVGFNNRGYILTPVSGDENGLKYKIGRQADGKIISLMENYSIDNNHTLFVSRLNVNGSLDNSFGVNGTSAFGIDKKPLLSLSLALDNDQRILTGGAFNIDPRYHPFPFITRMLTVDGLNARRNDAVAALSINKNISIYPNPAQNVLHIEGLPSSQNLPANRQGTKLTVVDFNGNIAMSYELSAMSSSYNFNIASLHAGNYLLKIETNGEVIIKQFMKE